MSIAEQLSAAGLKTALVIDDGFDAAPSPEDLVADEDAWSNFMADVGPDLEVIRNAFPQFDELSAEQLRVSPDFVAKMWSLEGQISETLWEGLFGTYRATRNIDSKFLEKLMALLAEFGLAATPAGRKPGPEDGAQDVFFVDLFLGMGQQHTDIDRSIAQLDALLKDRRESPPVVILMSRSEVLAEHWPEFRDRAGLVGAMFRVAKKSDLLEPGRLERLLDRLSLQVVDARKLAKFLRHVDIELTKTKELFLKSIRRLDLPDYMQIHELLLDREGQPLGSYVLDVFDRVHQFEMEGRKKVIEAAQELSSVDTTKYLAPHLAGSPDLQELVYKVLFQNPERLVLKSAEATIPVSFGDLLVKRAFLAGDASATSRELMVVLTPACDLVRTSSCARTVLLMSGQLLDLIPKSWTYGQNPLRTPIVILSGGRRMWIRWDVKHPVAISMTELAALVSATGDFEVKLRFREQQAIELQQRMLADLGRVGLIANMPGTFPVSISAGYQGAEGGLIALDLPKAAATGGVCYAGQDLEGDDYARLVLTEPVIDELLSAIANIAEASVSAKSRTALRLLLGTNPFAQDLLRGLKLAPNGKYAKLEIQMQKDDGTMGPKQIGFVARNPTEALPANSNHAALVITVTDVQLAE